MASEFPGPRVGGSSSGAPPYFTGRAGKERASTSSLGSSQSVSRCCSAAGGLVALNFARIAFRMKQSMKTIPDTLVALNTLKIIEKIMAICTEWSDHSHLKIDDIYRLPVFHNELKLAATHRAHVGGFSELLWELQHIQRSAVLIITCPPEIVACFKLGNAESSVFVIFDSHPRPSHPRGAGMLFSTSITEALHTLNEIHRLADENFQQSHRSHGTTQDADHWLGHILVSRDRLWDPKDSVGQSNQTASSLYAQNPELYWRNQYFKSCADRRSQIMRENLTSQTPQRSASVPPPTQAQHPARARRGTEDNVLAGPSRHPASQRSGRPGNDLASSAGSSWWLPDVERHTGGASVPTTYDLDFALATNLLIDDLVEIQVLHDRAERHRRAQRPEAPSTSTPRSQSQVTFTCGICMDEHPEYDVARVDQCSHSMCRDCLKDFVSSKIQERRFPILCPICTANTDTRAEPAEITRFLIEQLNVTERQLQTLTEMELAPFTLEIVCPKCKRPGIADRQDFMEVSMLRCLQPDCNNVWCKKCDQTVVEGGPTHSCDGSSELKQLMQREGWKACPQCTTPIQKISGCDHMTCIAPGCNTHFCYLCGDTIARAPPSQPIGAEIMTHASICRGHPRPPTDPPRRHQTHHEMHRGFIPPLPHEPAFPEEPFMDPNPPIYPAAVLQPRGPEGPTLYYGWTPYGYTQIPPYPRASF